MSFPRFWLGRSPNAHTGTHPFYATPDRRLDRETPPRAPQALSPYGTKAERQAWMRQRQARKKGRRAKL